MTRDKGTLTYVVGGMDCASCAAKVEQMMAGVAGASAVQTSFSHQTLSLRLDEAQTSRKKVEANLRDLGYRPALLEVEGHHHRGEHGHHHAEENAVWYETAQGRLVLTSGLLLALAWLFGRLAPELAAWGFGAATLLGVWPLTRRAWASLRLGDPFSINTLVTLAALGALAIGQTAEGAAVVFLFSVGELLEGVAAGRARAGIQALAALRPQRAFLSDGREVAAESLRVGQVVRVGAGERVPADGEIVAGRSALDDSPVTGESVPVSKGVGERVYAGSINGGGRIEVRVTRAAEDNTIARITRLVEEAEESKAPTARFIDRFSRWYTPAVVAASALTALVPPLLGGGWHTWLYRGIALLLIGCPCALVLSVPAAITSGVSAGARRGLLIKGGAALERVGTVRAVAFDKTGTLTAGRPTVTDVVGERREVLRLAAAAEAGSHHPLARAIARAAQAEELALPAATDVQALAGRGVSAEVAGKFVQVLSPEAAGPLSGEYQRRVTEFEEAGHTAVVVLEEGQPRGLIAMRDEARADAAAAVRRLRALGIYPLMLTGDNARAAGAVAAALDLEARAQLLPEDKLRAIDELRVAGGVAMVGDGINDAPALARADVGIAIGGGTDVALETADAALLRSEVSGVADMVELSRATTRNIRENIFFALGLKAVFLVTTLLGYTNLWMAVLADTGATAIVTANALRLLRWEPRHD